MPAVAGARPVLVERCPELDHRGIVQLVQIIRLRFFRLGGVLRHIAQPLDDGRARYTQFAGDGAMAGVGMCRGVLANEVGFRRGSILIAPATARVVKILNGASSG